MKTLVQLLNDAVVEAYILAYKGKIKVSPAFFDIRNYIEKEKCIGYLICARRFGGYELQRDSSLQGYGITFNTKDNGNNN